MHNLECRLCGKQNESLNHILRFCPESKRAKELARNLAPDNDKIRWIHNAHPGQYTLSVRCPAERIPIMTAFSYAVYIICVERSYITKHTEDDVAHAIAHLFLQHANPTPHRRKSAPKARQKRDFLNIYNAQPPDSNRCFTDGSSLENGEGGAGYALIRATDSIVACNSISLGQLT